MVADAAKLVSIGGKGIPATSLAGVRDVAPKASYK